jgi:hypothetical protein
MATGELETLILFAVLRLGDGAYGVSIRDEIEARTGRHLTRGAIYTALPWVRARRRRPKAVCLLGSGRAWFRPRSACPSCYWYS